MSQSEYKKLQRQFKTNPSVNPETGRKIDKNGVTYKQLVYKYGSPTKRSPRVTKSPRVARSPLAARSPRVTRSPHRQNKGDPFEVLSEESILRVLQKLNTDHRRVWC